MVNDASLILCFLSHPEKGMLKEAFRQFIVIPCIPGYINKLMRIMWAIPSAATVFSHHCACAGYLETPNTGRWIHCHGLFFKKMIPIANGFV